MYIYIYIHIYIYIILIIFNNLSDVIHLQGIYQNVTLRLSTLFMGNNVFRKNIAEIFLGWHRFTLE